MSVLLPNKLGMFFFRHRVDVKPMSSSRRCF